MAADSLALAMWVVALPLALLTFLLLTEVAAGVAMRGRAAAPAGAEPPASPRPRIAVLVPAHDEAGGIAATLATIVPQLAPGDRLLVVADNCSDTTAAVARAAGAEAIERREPARRGKGYALDFGIRHLAAAPPDCVVVVDADCTLHAGSLDRLARLCVATSRPVQALDLMHAPAGAGLRTRFAEFAWVVKNQARPLGGLGLGLPCQLMGTGMAFPWPLIRGAPLASGHIVEDMRLGLDLAGAGAAPLFCPQAQVSSFFPGDARGQAAQRARWEGGHLGVIVGEAPAALWRALRQGRPQLAAMAVDLCIPPLTVLLLVLVAQAAIDAVLVTSTGVGAGALALALASLAMLVLAVALAWHGFGRAVVSLPELLGAPLYVLAKLPLYARMLGRGKAGWVRAKRDPRDE